MKSAYKTVCGDWSTGSDNSIDKLVNAEIALGWTPIGGASVVFVPDEPSQQVMGGIYIIQAMTRKMIHKIKNEKA